MGQKALPDRPRSCALSHLHQRSPAPSPLNFSLICRFLNSPLAVWSLGIWCPLSLEHSIRAAPTGLIGRCFAVSVKDFLNTNAVCCSHCPTPPGSSGPPATRPELATDSVWCPTWIIHSLHLTPVGSPVQGPAKVPGTQCARNRNAVHELTP